MPSGDQRGSEAAGVTLAALREAPHGGAVGTHQVEPALAVCGAGRERDQRAVRRPCRRRAPECRVADRRGAAPVGARDVDLRLVHVGDRVRDEAPVRGPIERRVTVVEDRQDESAGCRDVRQSEIVEGLLGERDMGDRATCGPVRPHHHELRQVRSGRPGPEGKLRAVTRERRVGVHGVAAVSACVTTPSWLDVTMLPSTLIANRPGSAGPKGGGTRGRSPPRRAWRPPPRAAGRPARPRGRLSGARAERAAVVDREPAGPAPGRRGGTVIASTRPAGAVSAASAANQVARRRSMSWVAFMPPVLPRAVRRAHRPRGRRASRWSRGGAGTSPCRPARPWHRPSPRS